MKNWRKVFAKSESFKDKFKRFPTENKQELINRAEFTGDKPPKSGDSAKKELDAWKAGDKLSKKDRAVEQKSNGSAVLNEKVKREDFKSQKTSNWRDVLIKTADVNFKQKQDGEVNISVTTPQPQTSSLDNSSESEDTENEEIGETLPADDDIKPINPRFFNEEELRERARKSKLNWRDILAASEPDVQFKRKPDGTFELNVTHPQSEPDLPILNTTPPNTSQPDQNLQQASSQKKQLKWLTYTPGMTVVIKRIPGFTAGGESESQEEIVKVTQKYDTNTGDGYDVVETSGGSLFDTRDGTCIRGPKAYYMVVDPDEFKDTHIGSKLEKEASCKETIKNEWIIKEANKGNNTYRLIGRECDKFCGIFIEKKVMGILSKAASKSKIIDSEKVEKIGSTWRDNINEAVWISKFDGFINGK